MMDCVQFEALVHDLDRVGSHAASARASAMQHAESCRRCGRLLEDVRSLDLALHSLATVDAGSAASARLETALLAEFRRRNAEREKPQANFRLAALAVAACGLLAFGVVWRLRHVIQPVSPAAAPVANQSPITPVVTQSPATASAGAAKTPVAATELAAAAEEKPEYATSFVPLPYADDPATLEGATVVRVTMSRATLASFGMPVAEFGAAERIPADIALSEDGVPQAIRLVADADADAGGN